MPPQQLSDKLVMRGPLRTRRSGRPLERARRGAPVPSDRCPVPRGHPRHGRAGLSELLTDQISVGTATLGQPANGLPAGVLDGTDVLLWWGHLAHDAVDARLASAAAMLELEGGSVVGWAKACAAPAPRPPGPATGPVRQWESRRRPPSGRSVCLDGTVIPVSRQASSFSSRLRLTDRGPGSRREVHLPIAVYWSLHPCCCSH